MNLDFLFATVDSTVITVAVIFISSYFHIVAVCWWLVANNVTVK